MRQVSSQLELWAEELQHMEMVTDGAKAEQLLQMHNDSVLHMQNCTFEVLQRGQELCQVCGNQCIVCFTPPPPKGRLGFSDVSPLSGISGLSV